MKRSLILLTAVFLILVSGIASAQQSDLSASLTGAFTSSATGNGVTQPSTQTATNSAGILLSYRFFLTRNSGIEANYGYTKNSQVYTPLAAVQTNVSEVTGAYVLRASRGPVRPFALVGGGVLVFSPTNSAFVQNNLFNIYGLNFPIGRQTRPAFLYGVGADFRVNRAIAVRAQYRGLLYEAPDFQDSTDLHTGAAMHTAEPSIGLVFRF